MTGTTTDVRTGPTARLPIVVLLGLLVAGAGANVGAGTVLLVAAGMVAGAAWSVTGFVRRVGELRVVVADELVVPEGRATVPATLRVPRGVIGVVGVRRRPPGDATRRRRRWGLGGTSDGDAAAPDRWGVLPRGGTSAEVALVVDLGRGDAQRTVVEVELTDLLGLVRRRWTLLGPLVDVVPAGGSAAAPPRGPVAGVEDEAPPSVGTAHGPPGAELRPWRPGDPVGAVHWPASERADTLLTRPRTRTADDRRTLRVEDRAWTRDELDVRCRELAATAERLVRDGVEVEVEAGGRLLSWGPEARLLLARLRPNASDG